MCCLLVQFQKRTKNKQKWFRRMLPLPRRAKSKVYYCTLIQWAAAPTATLTTKTPCVSVSVRDVCLSSRSGTHQVFPRQTSVPHLLSVSEQACSFSTAAQALSRHLPCAEETGVSVNPYVAQHLRGCGATVRGFVGSEGGLRDGKWSTFVPNFFPMLFWNTWTFYADISVYKTFICSLSFSCTTWKTFCHFNALSEKLGGWKSWILSYQCTLSWCIVQALYQCLLNTHSHIIIIIIMSMAANAP